MAPIPDTQGLLLVLQAHRSGHSYSHYLQRARLISSRQDYILPRLKPSRRQARYSGARHHATPVMRAWYVNDPVLVENKSRTWRESVGCARTTYGPSLMLISSVWPKMLLRQDIAAPHCFSSMLLALQHYLVESDAKHTIQLLTNVWKTRILEHTRPDNP